MKRYLPFIYLFAVLTFITFSFTGCKTEPDEIHVTKVTLNKSELTLAEGETYTLTATVEPDNATDKDVEWKSDDEKVATVKDGRVTAVAEGTAVVTVITKDGNKKDKCTVTVEEPIDNPENPSEQPESPEVKPEPESKPDPEPEPEPEERLLEIL